MFMIYIWLRRVPPKLHIQSPDLIYASNWCQHDARELPQVTEIVFSVWWWGGQHWHDIILTGDSCATPRSNVACWGGSLLSPGSWLSEETSAAFGCRSLWICVLSCRHKAKEEHKFAENTAHVWTRLHHWDCFSCYAPSSEWSRYLASERRRLMYKWWVEK